MPVYSLSYASFVNNKKETMAELERMCVDHLNLKLRPV